MPLPQNFKRHSLWVLLALAACGSSAVLSESMGSPWKLLAIPLGVAGGLITMVYACYYFVVFPVLHAARRYQGNSQNAWLACLTLETLGLAAPFIRLAYLFSHILPDIRGTGAYRR